MRSAETCTTGTSNIGGVSGKPGFGHSRFPNHPPSGNVAIVSVMPFTKSVRAAAQEIPTKPYTRAGWFVWKLSTRVVRLPSRIFASVPALICPNPASPMVASLLPIIPVPSGAILTAWDCVMSAESAAMAERMYVFTQPFLGNERTMLQKKNDEPF